MASKDIGGGQDGSGGTLADGSADDAVEKPVLEGLELKNYSPTIFAEATAAEVAAFDLGEDATAVTQYQLVTVNADTLTVQEFDGNTAGTTILIARPYNQRRSVFDGREVVVVYNGELVTGTYTYETDIRRVFEFENGRQIIEEVFPPYITGDSLYGAEVANGVDVEGTTFLDLNSDARKFRPINQGLRQLVIVSEEFDYWVCRPYVSGMVVTDGSVVNVAKPFNLRKTPFDITDVPGDYNGIEYTYAVSGGKVQRTAEDTVEGITQLEVLIPQVFFEQSIIYAALAEETGVEVDGSDLKLLDINADSRYWTRRG